MTLQELIYEVRQMRGSTDTYKGKAGQAEETRLLNIALRMIGRYLRITDPSVTWNLQSGVQTYDFGTGFGRVLLEPFAGIVAGQELTDGDGHWRFCSSREFNEIVDWRLGASGQPTAAMIQGNRQITLDKKPTPWIVNRGNHFVESKILPGVRCESGVYLKGGFAVNFSEEEAVQTVGVKVALPGSAGAIDIGGGVLSDIANAGNILTDNGLNATITVPAPAFDPGQDYLTVSAFAFGLPVGAVVQDVRVKSVEIGATGDAAIYFRWCQDVGTGAPPIAEQFIGVSGAMAERGPLPYQAGVNASQVSMSTFGLQICALHQASDPNFTGGMPMTTPLAPISVTLDSIQLEVRYTVESASGGGSGSGATMSQEAALSCSPDLPEEVHWALAALATIVSAEPAISEDVALARLAKMEGRYAILLRDMRAENARSSSSLNGARPPLFGGFYRGR